MALLESIFLVNDRNGPSPEERDTVARIRSGDYAAFEGLYRTCARPLLAFAERIVANPEAAEEVVHEVFLNIWKGRETWRPRGQVKTYLYGAVRNRALREKQNRRRMEPLGFRAETEADVAGSHPDRLLQQAELERAVSRAVEALPERQGLVFTLSRRHEMTYAEIAAVLGIAPATVEVHMVRALRFLRKRLRDFL